MFRSDVPRIARGATLSQLLYAAGKVDAKVTGEGSQGEGWILQIEPRDKSREFFSALFTAMTGDRIKTAYPSPLDLTR